jgi:aminoglycoside phosphotransferase (APT) family kinase protein
MQLALDLPKLINYAQTILDRLGPLWKVETVELAGGSIAEGVYRYDLVFRLAPDHFQTVSVVQKYTHEMEVRVMAALAELAAAPAIPFLIDSAIAVPAPGEKTISCFITPFYEGRTLTFEDDIPAAVIESLAQVHLYFAPRLNQFQGLKDLYQVDVSFFRRTLNNAQEALAQLHQRQPQPLWAGLQDRLEAVRHSHVFETTLAGLPLTLAHGDVHPGNIIQSPTGEATLIDWGNTRIAPALLDLANVVELDSPNWFAYLSAWGKAGGPPLDPHLLRQGYYWATAMVNLQYLPYATNYSVENVPGMAERVLDAQAKLSSYRQ